jgi:hypothetical protein
MNLLAFEDFVHTSTSSLGGSRENKVARRPVAMLASFLAG